MTTSWRGSIVPMEYNRDPMVLVGKAMISAPYRPGAAGHIYPPMSDMTCLKCGHEKECRDRDRRGLWVLCEIPDEYDLRMADVPTP